jgi:hypothetical protein
MEFASRTDIMETRCPNCRSTVQLDLAPDVRTDGGSSAALPDGLRGTRRHCGECGHPFDVYVY